MSTAVHCDAAGCGTWSKSPGAHGFLALSWLDDLDDPVHFCGTECLLRWAAVREPMVEVAS